MPKTGLDSSWESEVEQNLLSAPDQLGDSLEVIFLNGFADVYFPYVIGITPHCTSHFLFPTLPPSRLSLLSDDDGLWSCELALDLLNQALNLPQFVHMLIVLLLVVAVFVCQYWPSIGRKVVCSAPVEMSGKIVFEMSYEISC